MSIKRTIPVWHCDLCGGREESWDFPKTWERLMLARTKRWLFWEVTSYGGVRLDLCPVCNGSHPRVKSFREAVRSTIKKMWEMFK